MKIKFYKLIYIVSVFSITYLAFIASNKDNPVRLKYSNAQRIYDFIPQGWAFFTRNPKENVVKLYKLSDRHNLEYINSTTSLSYKDLFGIKRHKRRISAELSEIISNMKKGEKWKEYRNVKVEDVSKEISTSDTITNNFVNPLLERGEYVIYSSKRLPWAWENSKVNLPFKIKKIYIR